MSEARAGHAAGTVYMAVGNLIFAAIVGYAVWAAVPGVNVWLGSGIIAAAGLVLIRGIGR